ncbi:MAG: carboxypeptidase regulatory-like domain-containing protein, partial [Planctomycetota bacterium]
MSARIASRAVLVACAALAALAIAGGACWLRRPAEDAVIRGAPSAARSAHADAALEARADEPAPSAARELDPASAAPKARRSIVAGSDVVRGRLLAPADMPLPEKTRMIAVVDDDDWQSFLHQRAGGARLTLQVGADGEFGFAWPFDADRVTLYADAPTLADVALAVIHRSANSGFTFARVERVPGEWIAPTLAPQQRVAYSDGALELRAQPAIVLIGRLGAAPAPGERLTQHDFADVIVRAWLDEQLEWKIDRLAPGASFRFEHVPLGGDVSVRIEGPHHWLEPLSIPAPRAGETRDLGELGERRYSLRGRLVDARGAPVASGGVRAHEVGRNGFPMHVDWTSTDAEGRFTLQHVPPRAIVVRAGRNHPEFGTPGVLTSVEIAPEAVLADAELLLQLAPSAHLAGLVLRPDGTPAAGARLRIERSARDRERWDGDGRFDAHADEHGRFAFFEVPARALDLCAWEDRQLLNEPNLVARLGVAPGTDDLVVRLAPIAPLRGRLVTDGGAPWNERWYLETSSDSVDWWGGTFDTSAFEHTRLWPGRWWIQARTESGLRTQTIELDVPADL